MRIRDCSSDVCSSDLGPFNFSMGGNALNFKSQDDYYVFSNMFSLLAEYFYNREDIPGEVGAITRNCDAGNEFRECVYVDPNPIDAINGEGHNYFRSKNVVQTRSWALFGEAYWNVTDDVQRSEEHTSELQSLMRIS